jgi:putative addiction module CopG family antidote
MNVSLTPKLEEYVRKKVTSGLYNNASEVIREALRLLMEREGAAAETAGDLPRPHPRCHRQHRGGHGSYGFEKFRKDRRARQLVERNLEILSEASRRIPESMKK